MPKELKTLERNEGKAPLLVPQPEEEDENFRQLSLRFLHSRQWRSPGHHSIHPSVYHVGGWARCPSTQSGQGFDSPG